MILSEVISGFQFGLQDSRRECLFLVSHPTRSVYHLSSSGSLLCSQFSVPMHFDRSHNLGVILSIV
jgi:hypothetical protein